MDLFPQHDVWQLVPFPTGIAVGMVDVSKQIATTVVTVATPIAAKPKACVYM